MLRENQRERRRIPDRRRVHNMQDKLGQREEGEEKEGKREKKRRERETCMCTPARSGEGVAGVISVRPCIGALRVTAIGHLIKKPFERIAI